MILLLDPPVGELTLGIVDFALLLPDCLLARQRWAEIVYRFAQVPDLVDSLAHDLRELGVGHRLKIRVFVVHRAMGIY